MDSYTSISANFASGNTFAGPETPNENELLEALRQDALRRGRPGPEWRTTAELAAKLAVSESTVQRRLRTMILNDRAERSGTYYRLVKP